MISIKMGSTLALTLTLSPGERGQLSHVCGWSKVRAAFAANGWFARIGVSRGGNSRLLHERRTYFPLLGERVWVRASVPLILLFSFSIRRRHRLGVFRQRMRSAFLQCFEDRIADRLFLPPQLRIPEAKLLDAQRGQELRSLRIVSLLSGMPVLSAVELDGETRLTAVEIEKVNPARVITAELVGAEAPVTQPTPHELLGPSCLLPQDASVFSVGHGGNVTGRQRKEKNGVNARPHPGHQERGNRPPSSPVIKLSHCLRVSLSELSRRGNRQFDSGIFRNAQKLSPHPGGEGQGEGARRTNFTRNLVLTPALTPALSPRRGGIVRRRSTRRTVSDYATASVLISNSHVGGAS